MAKTSSVVEINGNPYDLTSANFQGAVQKAEHQAKKTPSGVIDGFTLAAGRALPVSLVPHLTKSPEKKHSPKKGSVKKLKPAAQSVHHRAQRSYTLMRTAVKKQVSEQTPKADTSTKAKVSSPHNHTRVHRAQAVLKNSNVSRFASSAASPEKIEPQHSEKLASHRLAAEKTPRSSHASTSKAKPLAPAGLSNQQLERMLDVALARADAHKKAQDSSRRRWKPTRWSPRWLSFSTIALIVVLLSGFFAWQNVPQIAIRMAATRADIPASVPDYTPSGFSFSGPITYGQGKVTINFKANSDGFRKYTITQQKSPLGSKELAADGLPSAQQVQTSQVAGTTVYIYGPNNDATWVNRGVLYTLKDNALLTSDQILKIVGSM